MREIEYKAWDKKNRQIKNVTQLDFGYMPSQKPNYFIQGLLTDVWLNNECEAYAPTEVILMPYIGMKSDDSEKIYDGYIVDIIESRLDGECIITKNIQVDVNDYLLMYRLNYCNSIKIVGNIFENSNY